MTHSNGVRLKCALNIYNKHAIKMRSTSVFDVWDKNVAISVGCALGVSWGQKKDTTFAGQIDRFAAVELHYLALSWEQPWNAAAAHVYRRGPLLCTSYGQRRSHLGKKDTASWPSSSSYLESFFTLESKIVRILCQWLGRKLFFCEWHLLSSAAASVVFLFSA